MTCLPGRFAVTAAVLSIVSVPAICDEADGRVAVEIRNAPDFDPMPAATCRFVVGRRDPKTKRTAFSEDGKTLGEQTRLANGKGGLAKCAGSYSYSARGAVVCGVDGGFPQAGEALAEQGVYA